VAAPSAGAVGPPARIGVLRPMQNPADIDGPLDAIAAARVEVVIVLASPQLDAARRIWFRLA
jgi:hypothetical protein